jgi:hypothetical protein
MVSEVRCYHAGGDAVALPVAGSRRLPTDRTTLRLPKAGFMPGSNRSYGEGT